SIIGCAVSSADKDAEAGAGDGAGLARHRAAEALALKRRGEIGSAAHPEHAAEKLHEVLKGTPVFPMQKLVVTNVDAKVLKNENEIVPSLVRQVNNSVLWVPSIELMIEEGVDTFVEIGPGKALSGFVKRIAKGKGAKVNIFNIEDMNSFKNYISSRNGEVK
ncbi:MAG TPA: hypothetical protein P5044_10605, partial [bacterium]|nr:hypothetical protein [bacterium]